MWIIEKWLYFKLISLLKNVMCVHIYFISLPNFSVRRVCDETKIRKLICELLGNLILSPETLPSPYFKKKKTNKNKTSAFIIAWGISTCRKLVWKQYILVMILLPAPESLPAERSIYKHERELWTLAAADYLWKMLWRYTVHHKTKGKPYIKRTRKHAYIFADVHVSESSFCYSIILVKYFYFTMVKITFFRYTELWDFLERTAFPWPAFSVLVAGPLSVFSTHS